MSQTIFEQPVNSTLRLIYINTLHSRRVIILLVEEIRDSRKNNLEDKYRLDKRVTTTYYPDNCFKINRKNVLAVLNRH